MHKRLPPADRRDAYFTPDPIADELLNYANNVPATVMDPAVGEGALLRAALRRWPDALALGLDVDLAQLRRTKSENPSWRLGRVDMFSDRSRAASAIWRESLSSVDLIVVNPPFSYRGNHSKSVEYSGEPFFLTPASAFVALALSRLRPHGELLALLPGSALATERDERFWQEVRKTHSVEVVAELPATTFPRARTRALGVAIRPQQPFESAKLLPLPVETVHCIELIRGRVPVHTAMGEEAAGATAPLLHTRDLAGLEEWAVDPPLRAGARLATPGPFVVLPRVGRPSVRHLQIVDAPEDVVLSDCLFALRASDPTLLAYMLQRLRNEIQALRGAYSGGCAPYLTIRRLTQVLAGFGFCAHHASASAPRTLHGEGLCTAG